MLGEPHYAASKCNRLSLLSSPRDAKLPLHVLSPNTCRSGGTPHLRYSLEDQRSPESACNESPSPECKKKKRASLLSSYTRAHPARINHFVRHSDVEVKKEKKATVHSIAGQKLAMQKLDGWKVSFFFNNYFHALSYSWLITSDDIPFFLPVPSECIV